MEMAASTRPLLGMVPGPAITRARTTRARIGAKVSIRSGIYSGVSVKASGESQNDKELRKLPVEEGAETEPKKPQPGVVSTWFGEYRAWPEIHRLLTERNVKSVGWQEAYDLEQSGAAVLLDVREVQDFKVIHAKGSFGAPLFRLIQGNDLKTNLRRLGYALLTDFAGTERNPNFVQQALQAVDGDMEKLVIVLCDIGGTLSTIVERKGPKAKKFADPERRFGRASRALRAVFELQEAGFRNVTYLSGGFQSWLHEDLPSVGD